MEVKFVDLKKNFESIKNEIIKKVDLLFENCDFISGRSVKNFEDNFAKYIGTKHFIGCANGTDALEIAVKVLDLKEDDEIIVQGNTYIATCLGVLNNNIKLVLCDIDPETHMIDMNEIEKKINEKTKAIIVVHLFGLMPDMEKIKEITEKNNLYLIEDCAQAHGAHWNGKNAGTFGDLACFSFYPGKNLGAYGDGGGIATNNDEYNDKIRILTNLGCKIKYHHEILGRNSRLDTLQASFLDVKLGHLDKWNSLRRNDALIYENKLKDVGDICFPKVEEGCVPVYHLYVIKTKYRDELKSYLEDKKIQCLIHYPISIAETEAMSKYNFDLNDVKHCIKNSKEILSLPMFPELEYFEIEYICNSIKQFFMEKNLLKIKSIEIESKDGILNCLNNMNFDVKRFFYIDQFKNKDNYSKRGLHVNLNFNEFIIIIEGSITLKLIDKNREEKIIILKKNDTYYIPSMYWIEFDILDLNTVLLCFTDKSLNESVSLHSFEEFLQL